MSKKNAVFSIIVILVISSFCFFSFCPIKTNGEVDDQQTDICEIVSSTPKSSAYEVLKRWNYTSNYEVTSVAVSADGNYMVAGIDSDEDDGDVILFFNTSVHDGRPMWIYKVSAKPISSVAISADGEYIVAASQDGFKAYLLNKTVPEAGKNKEEVWYVNFGISNDYVYSVDISANGTYIVMGGQSSSGDGFIVLYNNSDASTDRDKTGEKLWYYSPYDCVNSVTISADGMYVAAGTDYDLNFPEIYFFNTTDYTYNQEHKPEWTFDAEVSVDLIAISANGYYFVAASEGKAYLLNQTLPAPTGKKEMWYNDWGNLDWHIFSIDISADGKIIVMGGRDNVMNGYIGLYNNSYASSGLDKAPEYLWNYISEGDVNSVAITAYGEYIVVGTDKYLQEDTVFLFNNTDYTYNQEHEPEWDFNTSYNINSVSISSWGNYIGAGGNYSDSRGMTYLFYHARPLPIVPPLLQGDDDSGGNDEVLPAIPFGNHYLIFIAIGIVSLVIILKRKLFLSKK